jgi:hypothetical protein
MSSRVQTAVPNETDQDGMVGGAWSSVNVVRLPLRSFASPR